MARIALKVDVDTLHGTLEGVPRLLSLFEKHRVRATFLFSLGPDHTGWALRRVIRPGFLSKVARTSVLSHYGLRTLAYGVLLPAPDIGRRAAPVMRAARRAGHECGIHTWDHVVWHDNVRTQDAAWTRRQMRMAFDRYGDIFGEAPTTHGAAGWQMNAAALSQIDAWAMAYASDGRGSMPYRVGGEAGPHTHVQIPTTLPTLDELIGTDGMDDRGACAALLTSTDSDEDQVFTLHAELEGRLLAPTFDLLLSSWKAQGHELVDLCESFRHLRRDALPERPFAWGTIAGRSGELMVMPTVMHRSAVRSVG